MAVPLHGRRTLVLLIALVTVLAMTVPAAGAADSFQQPSGEEILDQVEQQYTDADTVTGDAVLTTSNATGTMEANVSFAFASPDSYRFVVENDDATYRTGSNGTVGWAVGPQGAAVWDADSPEAAAGAAGSGSGLPANDSTLDWVAPTDVDTENVDVELIGETEVDGVPVYELDVVPSDGGETDATTLWVAQDDYRVLQAATTSETRLTVVDVQDVRFDVDVHESTFQPPEDRLDAWSIDRYDSFEDAQDATDLDLPQFEDGDFENATVTSQQDETVVAQEYTLDGENVTLVSTTATDRFQDFADDASQVDIDDRNASVTEFDGGAVVLWTEDDVTTAVVVEDSSDQAIEIAGQVSD